MARVKFSPLISEIRGKLGNAVFQGNKSGIILREHVKPRNNNTELQQKVRSTLATIKSAWQNLTTDELNSWKSLAQLYQKGSKNNVTKKLSPYELFIAKNMVNSNETTSILLTTSLQLNTVDQFFVDLTLVPNVSFKAEIEAVGDVANTLIHFYISKPYKRSASIPKSSVRWILISNNPTGIKPLDQKYINLYGRFPNVGEKVLVKVYATANDGGWLSAPYYKQIVIS